MSTTQTECDRCGGDGCRSCHWRGWVVVEDDRQPELPSIEDGDDPFAIQEPDQP